MARVWAVLSADSDAARVDCKAAGCTHAVINADWSTMQPSGAGSALSTTAAATLVAAFDHAVSIGLKPILSVNIHYPPAWISAGVEKFVDQLGNAYDTTGSGKQVRNWIWSQTGRTYVLDFWTKVVTALGPSRVALTDGLRLGGGWYGELHYPGAVSGGPTYAWQAFGASMQTGTDLATGMTVCPVPGYVPYTGTDDQDCAFLNWYLNGLVTWARWQVQMARDFGFTRNLWMMLPGYGVRSNQARTSNGYKQAASLGEDPVRVIGEFMHDIDVWPYSTWMNTADGFAGGTADSDKSAWKSLYEKSLVRGKHYGLVGENTGNESDAGMDAIFAGALGAATYAGTPGTPPTGRYYGGCIWLQHNTLMGGAQASMARYKTNIAAANAASP